VTKRADITNLRKALSAQHEADVRRREARAYADTAISQAIASGFSYDDIALVALRVALGRAPTPEERRRKVAALRQCRCRFVTGRHGNRARVGLKVRDAGVGSVAKENAMTRLLKRTTTTTEEFGIDDERDDAKASCDEDEVSASDKEDDDLDEDEEDEEDDDE
jgi:hypothetical protein